MTSLALLCVCVASSFLDPAKAHIPTCIGTDVSPADGDTFECSKQAADEECGRKYYVIQDIAWQCRRLGGDDCESTGLCSCVSAGFCSALSKAELQPRQEVSSKETAPQRCACENPGHSTFSECTQSKICACNGRVRLGYDTRWSEWKDVTGSISCSNGNFGADPARGQAKECVCDSTAPRLQTVEGFTAEAEGQGSACRGAHADDNRASYYTVHYSKSLQACKARCMATPVCSGIEFSTGRCELWTRSIDATRALASYTCLRYTPLQRGSNLAVIQTHGSRESHRRRRRSLNLKPAALSVA